MKNSTWIVGDVHGCYFELDQLLKHAQSIDPNSRFWFVGDLINRGPRSLDSLRRIIGLGDRSVAVLGNHDLHLLALASGVEMLNSKYEVEFKSILNAPDYNHLINWLRFRPLVHFNYNCLMVHAGVLANWDIQKILSIAAEIQDLLRAPNWQKKLVEIYKKTENTNQIYQAINVFTRVRLCDHHGLMLFPNKKKYLSKEYCFNSSNLVPWFDIENRATRNISIFFGHWSTLGLLVRPKIICLDTGCVWGGFLTAIRIHDRKLIQIPSHSSSSKRKTI